MTHTEVHALLPGDKILCSYRIIGKEPEKGKVHQISPGQVSVYWERSGLYVISCTDSIWIYILCIK